MALVQRPLRGSRISTFYPVKSLPSLSSLDSAFQLQEYISLLIRLDVHDVDAIVSIPTAKGKGKEKEADAGDDGKGKEVAVDEACWKYEQLRRLAQDLSHPLITMLQQVCTRTTCPEMKAGEWLYLCVAHGNDGAMEQCCAIDYILHTLDSATALLNSPRAFPSRLQIPPASHRHFTSLARRLGRIFAHAYFHHREEFEQAEAESSLYARFLALTEKFDLVPADFLVIPPRAVANEPGPDGGRRGSMVPAPGVDVPPPTLLGAALHVDTNSSAASKDVGEGARQQSPSPPGLDGADAVSPQSASRRYGRSRTDTMMLEGESGRFPASPASAAAEGPAELDAALAAAGVGMLPPSQALSAEPQEPEKAASPQVQEPESLPEPEHEAAQAEEQEQEPPSPTSDDEPAPGTAIGPVVSPSSSTAPQAESHPITSMLEREEAPSPIPTISVVPATPPPVDDAEVELSKSRGSTAAEESVAKEETAEAAPVEAEESKESDAGSDAGESVPTPAEDGEAKKEDEATGTLPEAPTPAAEETASAPSAEEEVDVTDTEKDAEVPVAAATSAEEPAKTEDKTEKAD